MTTRDRVVIMVIAVLALLGAGWLLLVSPERKKAADLQTEVNAATSKLAEAEGQAANARAAQGRYSSAYASVVNLGKAVPPSREVPSLVYELAQASDQKHVDLSSIVYAPSGSTAGSTSGSGSGAQASNATLAGFTQMPFTFIFNGSFLDLYKLFQQLNHFTTRTASGGLAVTGRLLTIQSAKLVPLVEGQSARKGATRLLSGTVTATAYVLPAAQGLTAGATPATPGASSASPVPSSRSGASSPAAPAVARVTP
jgi:hypothetical protein